MISSLKKKAELIENMEKAVKYTQKLVHKKQLYKKMLLIKCVKTFKNIKSQVFKCSSSDTAAHTLHFPILLRILACEGEKKACDSREIF